VNIVVHIAVTGKKLGKSLVSCFAGCDPTKTTSNQWCKLHLPRQHNAASFHALTPMQHPTDGLFAKKRKGKGKDMEKQQPSMPHPMKYLREGHIKKPRLRTSNIELERT
jgi:hypothetical protein